ncbi:SCO2322 family protein [Streptomyces sp. NPDC059913]|uniref:SCO2322 family protein n=1 Tax=unclassified Streptomyces TaxID=2593676 RepID=UPI00365CBC62
MRRAGSAAVLLVLGALLAVVGAAPAQAAGYRYWSFWEGSGSGWAYATQGPSLVRPDDGEVQGFRFAVSEDSRNAAKPRRAPVFAEICGDTPATSGTKRVAVVIDPGTAADAPGGANPPAPRAACARVAPDASAAEALAKVARPLRYDSNGMLCGIAGYPATGCGEQVSGGGHPAPATSGDAASGDTTAAPASPRAEADSPDGSGGPSAGVYVGVGAVLLLGVAGVVQARRRRG